MIGACVVDEKLLIVDPHFIFVPLIIDYVVDSDKQLHRCFSRVRMTVRELSSVSGTAENLSTSFLDKMAHLKVPSSDKIVKEGLLGKHSRGKSFFSFLSSDSWHDRIFRVHESKMMQYWDPADSNSPKVFFISF